MEDHETFNSVMASILGVQIIDAVIVPGDELDYVFNARWPGGGIVLCAKCGIERKYCRVRDRTSYSCPCGHHLQPLAGTIFHKSTTSLTVWFFVIKLMTSTRVGVSAKQIQRETGVTYKTAWRMMKQIHSKVTTKPVTFVG